MARVAVAIKPTALAPDYTPLTAEAGIASAKRRLLPILEMAAERGAQVWFDMERYQIKHLTHRLFRELLDEPGLQGLHAGSSSRHTCATASRRTRAWRVARPRVEAGRLPISVRLVKGAYWDTRRSWRRRPAGTSRLFRQAAERPRIRAMRAPAACTSRTHPRAFGSHNLRSLAYAVRLRNGRASPTTAMRCNSLRDGRARARGGSADGLRLRVYAPMGELVPGMRTSSAACSRTRRTTASSGCVLPKGKPSTRFCPPLVRGRPTERSCPSAASDHRPRQIRTRRRRTRLRRRGVVHHEHREAMASAIPRCDARSEQPCQDASR